MVYSFPMGRVIVNCSKDWHNFHIYKNREELDRMLGTKREDVPYIPGLLPNQRRKRSSL